MLHTISHKTRRRVHNFDRQLEGRVPRPTLRSERAKERTTLWIAEGKEYSLSTRRQNIYLESTEHGVVITFTVITAVFDLIYHSRHFDLGPH